MQSLNASIDCLHFLLHGLKEDFPSDIEHINKIGMIAGIKTNSMAMASQIQRHCFENGLILETFGPDASTLKLLPPLTIDSDDLKLGFDILRSAFEEIGH
jgi:diaminobutyrate-2-oxoglutarate transaminase